MTALVKRLMVEMFTGPGGQRLRASMMDENVKELPLKVNQRFPDEIPLATMPPRLLKVLPELPEQMEFRFVASQFVLLDQPFVRDPNLTISQLVAHTSATTGENITVSRFTRYRVGDGE